MTPRRTSHASESGAPLIVPSPPRSDFVMPWDSPDEIDPVVELTDARRQLGDTFAVESGGTTYLFTFSEVGLRSFYAVEERNASKGLADYRMLVRKLPDELFVERRTFAHDLFGAEEVQGYLDNLDWAIDAEIEELGDVGSFDVFDFSRRVGHRLGLACWMGREAPIADLIPEFEILDGAEAFVHPERSNGATKDEERAALARVEHVIRTLLARTDHRPSFLDDIAQRWDDVTDPAPGITGDVVMLHIATMTNLFAALAWALAQLLLHPTDASLEQCAFEAVRLGQRSIMLREVLRPLAFSDGHHEYRVERGVQLATMLPLTNTERLGVAYAPDRWSDRSLHRDVAVTTFGHGPHRCPAQRFSVSAIVRTLARLSSTFRMTPGFDEVVPMPSQIGGVARSARPCVVSYRRNE
jgi:cytochrome P450